MAGPCLYRDCIIFYHLTYRVRPSYYTLFIDQELADDLWLCGTYKDGYFPALCQDGKRFISSNEIFFSKNPTTCKFVYYDNHICSSGSLRLFRTTNFEHTNLFQQQRRLDLLTITSPSNMKPGNKKPHVVVVLSRIHPGESPTSFVCQGRTSMRQYQNIFLPYRALHFMQDAITGPLISCKMQLQGP
jgi:hypothetical protein